MSLKERFHATMPVSTAFGLEPIRKEGLLLSVGKYSYGVPTVSWARADKGRSLIIGSFCSIAAGVSIYVGVQGRHTTDFLSTYPIGMIFPIRERGVRASSAFSGDLDVHIGSDCWIGRDALILAGVRIGHGAVIAARAVITKDVPPYAIAAGVPAKVVKYRFDQKVTERLLNLQWWDYPDDVLMDNSEIFATANIEDILERLERIRPS